jgi:hypothetical protein
MTVSDVICSQYQASLDMLQQAVAACPASLWDDPRDKNRFWQIAYHALFYTHLYVQPSLQDFTPWAKHRPDLHRMGPPHGEPYTSAEILDYLAFCRQQVDAQVPRLDLEAVSGFDWLPMNKLEHQLYSIRHIMQHVGELSDRLGTRGQVDVDWVGMHPKDG